jgi:nicotinamidase-related amidase
MTPPPASTGTASTSTASTGKGAERLANAQQSVLLMIDIQSAFRGKLHQEPRMIEASRRLLQAASILSVPVVVTEQYPERLGQTVDEVAAVIPDDAIRISKRTFSCLGAESFRTRLRELNRSQVVLAGLETHICVGQTACELMTEGYQVHAVRDAITSRFPLESELGFAKMLSAGAIPTSVECVLFEWLRDSRSANFKAVQRLVL